MQQSTLIRCIAIAVLAAAACGLVNGVATLETVSDDDLMEMIKSETYVIVLFCKL